MKLLQFTRHGEQKLGCELEGNGDNILDLTESNHVLPNDMKKFIEGGEDMLLAAKRIKPHKNNVYKRCDVTINAPLYKPEKVLCVGLNYKDHCEEQNLPLPLEPVIFSKFPSCITGPSDDIEYPDEAKTLDWEVELAVVIGKEAKNVKECDAMKYVYGYTVVHDVSARDLYANGRNSGQVTIGKAMDCFCPIGPVIVTEDEIKDPHNLNLRCLVNGVTKQDSNTKQLIHKTEAVIEHITRFITLKPGDIILTGSPPGSGAFKKPPEYLQRGDIVVCEIEGIGKLENRIV